MILQDIINDIEEFAPLELQADYDNAGLICGDPFQDISSALITLDVTEEVVDEAITTSCQLIISHHPLSLKGFKHITPQSNISRALIKAIKNDIAIYSAHTNIDAIQEGVSGRMALKLGMEDCNILSPNSSHPNTGFGMVGNLKEPMDAYQFLNFVKKVFEVPTIRYTNIQIGNISRVALCGGSGSSLTLDAIASGADIYISGDFKYHDFFMAENRIIIADIGHYESEQFTKDIFYELLTKKLPKFAVQFSTVKTNPINYL